MSDLMTLKELVAKTAVALSQADLDQPSGRVSEVPSARTVRYYASHGLMDKPAGFDGRTALYGERHLLQLVAIKRLQASGLTLVEVQQRLVGASDEELARCARLVVAPAAYTPEETTEDAGQARLDFWRQRLPAPAAPTHPTATPAEHPDALARGLLAGVALADGALLVLGEARRQLTPEDRDALRAAAEPLLATLRARRLID